MTSVQRNVKVTIRGMKRDTFIQELKLPVGHLEKDLEEIKSFLLYINSTIETERGAVR